MAPTIFIKCCGFIVHRHLDNMTLSAIPGKIPETEKIVSHFLSIAYVATKPTDQSCPNSISRVPLSIFPAYVFNFQPTLKFKGSLYKKQANKLSDNKVKGSLYKKEIKIFYFLKNGSNYFDQIL